MKNNYLICSISLIMMTWPTFGFAGTIVVSNTRDTGAGSLRQAMPDAESNSDADTIVFNIPTSDPNYNSETGVWTTQPATELPDLWRDSTFIDGTSQTVNQGNLKLKGPEIEISGASIPEYGIVIYGLNITIRGLVSIIRMKS